MDTKTIAPWLTVIPLSEASTKIRNSFDLQTQATSVVVSNRRTKRQIGLAVIWKLTDSKGC